MTMDNYLVILQARTSSHRLPGKVLANINGKPMIEWIIKRIQKVPGLSLVVATSNHVSDDKLTTIVENLGVRVFRGSLDNVHSRFLYIVGSLQPSNFIRITGDCPLVMPSLIISMINTFENSECEVLTNTKPPTFPDGLDIEIVSSEAFLDLSEVKLTQQELEHVTLGFYSRPEQFKIENYESDLDNSAMRWTVDYEEDLTFIRSIYANFVGHETTFTFEDVTGLMESQTVRDNEKSHEFRNISLYEESGLD